MNNREYLEEMETHSLSQYATLSKNTLGRARKEEKCDLRTEFMRDRDRIMHCKSFRRLMHKTQVFISPEGDHYRTRLTHTLEVAQISRAIARALKLNEDLTEAIALGHDLGHTPFGHAGEDALNNILPGGFTHNEQSVCIVEKLEKNGVGLNLTREVLDGIREHRSEGNPATLEGKIVQLSDKIAYINHDIDDAIRAGLLTERDLPVDSTKILGCKSSSRIDFLIRSVIKASDGVFDIRLEEHVRLAMKNLRDYLFETVYENQLQKKEREKIGRILSVLIEYYMKKPEALPQEFFDMHKSGEDLMKVVANYIACMTDRFAIRKYEDIVMPSSWHIN